jgi:hypothetical protein
LASPIRNLDFTMIAYIFLESIKNALVAYSTHGAYRLRDALYQVFNINFGHRWRVWVAIREDLEPCRRTMPAEASF